MAPVSRSYVMCVCVCVYVCVKKWYDHFVAGHMSVARSALVSLRHSIRLPPLFLSLFVLWGLVVIMLPAGTAFSRSFCPVLGLRAWKVGSGPSLPRYAYAGTKLLSSAPVSGGNGGGSSDGNSNAVMGKSSSSGASKPPQGIDDLRRVRMDKINKFRAIGINPFAYNFDATHKSAELHTKYVSLPAGQVDSSIRVAVSGRIVAKRTFGKLAFLDVMDELGTIQAYIEKPLVGNETFKRLVDLTDVGDIIGVEGSIKRTDKGELSVLVSSWSMLTKSVLPLPDKFHGLQDTTLRYRHRHLDMIANPEVTKVLKARSIIISSMRRLLDSQGFLEVETPILADQPGGADARPFETFHNSLNMKLTLRIATELHLKRLIVGGLPRVYEIGRIFRNEGLSARHNPEFTSIELYQAYADYNDMMRLTENLVASLAAQLHGGSMKINCTRGNEEFIVDLTPPWRRVSMNDLVKEKYGLDVSSYLVGNDVEGCKRAARAAGVNSDIIRDLNDVGDIMNALFETIEGSLIQPTFVLHHPVSISPLAKPHRQLPGLTERFELFVLGRELANAFSELTDPVEQRQRLEFQILQKRGEDKSADRTVDEDFLHVSHFPVVLVSFS
jgi:lysyl-tRNA synthetase class 2